MKKEKKFREAIQKGRIHTERWELIVTFERLFVRPENLASGLKSVIPTSTDPNIILCQ